MNKRRRPYSVNGAVLIMVLTVMFVLIFLLAGAVAVVYTSNNRVMMQYEESQAYYTARSVIDIYHSMILGGEKLDDISGTDIGGNLVTGNYYELKSNGTGGYDLKPYTKISSGRALELDLYRVPVSIQSDSTKENYNPYYAKAIRGLNPTVTADAAKILEIQKQRNLVASDFSSDSTLSGYSNYYNQYVIEPSTAPTDSPTSVKLGVDDTLKYVINYKKDGSLVYSDFKTYQDGATAGHTNKLADEKTPVTLYVQVLDRSYEMSTDNTLTSYGAKFIAGDYTRVKDKFVIKVTAEVTYDQQTFSTSVIYSNGKKGGGGAAASKAIVSMSDIGSAESVMAIGGASTLSRDGSLTWLNDPNTESGVFLSSGLNTGNTNPYLYLGKDDNFFVRKDLTLNNYFIKGTYKTGATLYAGSIVWNPNADDLIGTTSDTNVLNIVSPKIVIGGDKGKIHGRGVFEVIDYTGVVGTNGWNNRVSYLDKSANSNSGQYFCNYLRIPKNLLNSTQTGYADDATKEKIVGCICGDGNITVQKGFILVDGGSETVLDVTGSAFDVDGSKKADGTDQQADQKRGKLKFANGGEIKIDYDTDFVCDQSSFQKSVTLPSGVKIVDGDGSLTDSITLDTVKSLYSDYFEEDDTIWNKDGSGKYDGDLTIWSDTNDTNYANFITEHTRSAETQYADGDTSKDLNNLSLSAVTLKTPASEVISTIQTDTGISGSNWKLIDSSGYISANKDEDGWYIIDGSKDITIQFGTGTTNAASKDNYFNGHYVVYGNGGTVDVVIPSTDSTNKETTANFGFTNGNFMLVDYDVAKDIKAKKIVVGDGTGSAGDTMSPNIKWYVSSNVKTMTFDNHLVKEYGFNGYVKAPKTTFVLKNGVHGTADCDVFTQNFTSPTNVRTQEVMVVGSITCGSFSHDISNKGGIVYIPEATTPGGGGEGKPLYDWTGEWYTMT